MIYVCCSAYNEALDLPGLLTTLSDFSHAAAQPVHMVFYNDGSTDDTRQILQDASAHLPITVLNGQKNLGLGYGIATLILYVVEHGNEKDVAVFMDADNSHDPAVIPFFMKQIEAGADVVIASRFQPQSCMIGFPWHRRVLSLLASWYFSAILSLPGIRDYTSGFRAYRVGILMRLDLHALLQGAQALPRGFECQVTLLHRLSGFGHISEVPFVYSYGAKKGTSKMRLFRTIRRSIIAGLGIAMNRMPQQ